MKGELIIIVIVKNVDSITVIIFSISSIIFIITIKSIIDSIIIPIIIARSECSKEGDQIFPSTAFDSLAAGKHHCCRPDHPHHRHHPHHHHHHHPTHHHNLPCHGN